MEQPTVPVGVRLPKKPYERLLKERARLKKKFGMDVSLSDVLKMSVDFWLEKARVT
jgi:hypothetical protein